MRIENRTHYDRVDDPVTSGVPLPEGLINLNPITRQPPLRIINPEGKEIPAQFTILSSWPDGSIRWVLLDFQASVPAENEAIYYLKDQGNGDSPKGMKVEQTDDYIYIDNGRLEFTINKNGPNLFEKVFLKDFEINPIITPKHQNGIELKRSKLYASYFTHPDEVRIEKNGPLHTVILMRGKFAAKDGKIFKPDTARYSIRIHTYLGKTFLRMFLTLENNGRYGFRHESFEAEPYNFDEVALKIKLNTKKQVTLQSEGYRQEHFPKERFFVYQRHSLMDNYNEDLNFNYMIKKDQKVVTQGKRFPGWLDISDIAQGMTVAVKHFWQNYPKAITYQQRTLSLGLWPLGGNWPPYAAKGYNMRGATHKTHEILLYFHKRNDEKINTKKMFGFLSASNKPDTKNVHPLLEVEFFNNPLFAIAPSEWYKKTKALLSLGYMTPKDEAQVRRIAKRYFKEKDILPALLNEQILKYDRSSDDYIYFDENIKTEANLKTRLNKTWLAESEDKMDYIIDLWEKSSQEITVEEALRRYEQLQACKVHIESSEMQHNKYPPSTVYTEREKRSEHMDWYGWMDFGDLAWGGNEGEGAYASLHYDWPYGMLLQFLRSNDYAFFKLADEMARHMMDIDHYHTSRGSPYLNNLQWNEFGNHDRAPEPWEPLPSHTWAQGLVLYHLLTGNMQAKEVALKIGKGAINYWSRVPGSSELRIQGWTIENMLALYQLTGKQKYFNFAKKIYTEKTLPFISKEGFAGDPRDLNIFPFTLSLEPLIKLETLTNDEDLHDTIFRMLDFLVNKAYIGGKDRLRGFSKNEMTDTRLVNILLREKIIREDKNNPDIAFFDKSIRSQEHLLKLLAEINFDKLYLSNNDEEKPEDELDEYENEDILKTQQTEDKKSGFTGLFGLDSLLDLDSTKEMDERKQKIILMWQKTHEGKWYEPNYLPYTFNVRTGFRYGFAPGYNFIISNALAYAYLKTGEAKYFNRARQLFKDAVFYWQTEDLLIDPTIRSPIAYAAAHFPGSRSKVHGWINRYPQIYLYMEAHPKTDIIPPAKIKDLEVIPGINEGEVILEWTAPGDDEYKGVANHYKIKYGAHHMESDMQWWQAANIPNEPAPLPPHTLDLFVIKGLEVGKTYFFAIRTYDEVDNLSPISNIAHITLEQPQPTDDEAVTPPPPKALDSDHDGVLDNMDKCPNTPAGVMVDTKGCPLDSDRDGVADNMDKCPNTLIGIMVDYKGCPPDSDHDGVADYMDKCPNTPDGIIVNDKGCPPDSDHDGVADYMDKCPNTPDGIIVNDKGCPPDSDHDGVADNMDKCPNTPDGIIVDEKGCPPDSDRDGVADYMDKCPNTSDGIIVDEKGCPLDSDHDGVLDNMDKCPNTRTGIMVDEKGCPPDSDRDGVADYLDKCPNTPDGVMVDEKGCPLDSDHDGVLDNLDKCPNTPDGVMVDEKGCPLDSDSDGVADYLDKCPGTPLRVAVDNKGCPLPKRYQPRLKLYLIPINTI